MSESLRFLFIFVDPALRRCVCINNIFVTRVVCFIYLPADEIFGAPHTDIIAFVRPKKSNEKNTAVCVLEMDN